MKLTTVAMFGAGYVLGTRAGRERYEQLRELGRRLAGELDGAGVREGLETVSCPAGEVRERQRAGRAGGSTPCVGRTLIAGAYGAVSAAR